MTDDCFMIKAVIFDLDGVVLDSEPIYRACWQRAATELGFELSDELYGRLIGRKDEDAERILIAEAGVGFPLAQFRGLWPAYWEQFIRAQAVPLKPGLTDLLDFLDKRDISLAIATSTERERALRSLGRIWDRFDVVVAGDEIKRGKPAPDIFLRAAEALSVPAGACWVLEDSEAGIQAAYAAGMKAVLIPDLQQPSTSVRGLAECVCDSLYEVRQILSGRLS